MKHRNVMAVIFWSLLTLGIYDLFWLVSVKKELNAKTSVKTPSILLLFAPIGVVFIAALIVAMSTGESSDPGTSANALAAILYIVAMLAFIPIYFWWFFKFSKAVSEYTHGELNTAVNMLLLWLLRFIGIAVMQDKFNDMLQAGGVPASATTPTAGTPTATASTESAPTASDNDSMPQQPATPAVPHQPSHDHDQTPPADPPVGQGYSGTMGQ
jgi:hypothetical protein